MTLRFKRNYPLVLMLVAILSILALTMGNAPIVSYTVSTRALQAVQLTELPSDVSNAITGLTSVFSAFISEVDVQNGTSNSIHP